jgi:hypothetical protein
MLTAPRFYIVDTSSKHLKLALGVCSTVILYDLASTLSTITYRPVPVSKMAPVSNINVALVSDEDMPTCAEVMSKAFGHDAPFVDIYFPNHDTAAGQAQASRRLTTWKQTSDSSVFLKAVTHLQAEDRGPAKTIGFAVWTLMKEAPPPELAKIENVDEVWPDKDDREFMTRLWREYVIPRTQSIKDSGGKGVYGEWRLVISE